mmetsp:Transcript_19955/g.45475  ORF Transcript_19955/g.45475 Transcript_19955/m.45475 type:complete len:402 (-) Transcript_19955:273-1478(-)
MNEEETLLAGKIGLGISVVLWLLCTWRLAFHSWEWFAWPGRERNGESEYGSSRNNSTTQVSSHEEGDAEEEQQQWRRCAAPCIRWITRRRAFHGLLWIATLCEVVSYCDLSGFLPFTPDRILAENIGYVLLNVLGRTFELLAFCTATEIWIQTAIDARPRSMDSRTSSQNSFWFRWLPRVFVVFTALLILASVSLSVVIFCRFPHSSNRNSALTTPISRLQTLLEASCWGIHVVMVAVSISMTSRCVLVLVPSTQWKKRAYLLIKAVGPMLASCVACATRCGWLIAVHIQKHRWDSWAWWISFAWGPTAIVSVMLLYSTRKRDHDDDEETIGIAESYSNDANSNSNSEDNLQQPLLRAQPPEEAFRAFHNFRRGEEDAEDSFSLGSPVPRRMPAPVAIEDP